MAGLLFDVPSFLMSSLSVVRYVLFLLFMSPMRLLLNVINATNTGYALKHEVSKTHNVTPWQMEKGNTPDFFLLQMLRN